MSDYRLVAPGSPMSHCVIVTVSRSVTFSHVRARQLFLSPQSRDPGNYFELCWDVHTLLRTLMNRNEFIICCGIGGITE